MVRQIVPVVDANVMSARAAGPLLLALLALGGCREGALTAAGAELSLPSELDFGTVYVGFEARQQLEVTNRGRPTVEIELTTTAPFTAGQRLRVPGGATVQLEVALTAGAEGPVAGTLSFEDREVALRGVGVLPPSCTPTSDCVEARFEPQSGCVEHPLDDGARCGANDRCVAGGRCRQGACVGQAVSCDDKDPCTVDGCSPAVGCLHLPLQCAQPGDRCLVASCEPGLGCRVKPAIDGARCGANDCRMAHVCIAGTCEERAAPDGSECGEATLCRTAGICSGQTCLPGTTVIPAPRWSYAPPAGMNVMQVVVDTHGTTFALVGTQVVYAADAGPPPYSLWLSSFDVDGHQRFSVNLSQGTPGLENGVALMADPDADRVYLAARTYNYGTATPHRVVVAQARNSNTGALLWEHDLHQGIALSNSSSGEMQLEVTDAMLLDPNVISFALREGESLHQAYVAALSTATGAEVWKVQRSGHLAAGASANGDVWESSAACWSQDFFLSRVNVAGTSSAQLPLAATLLAFGDDRALLQTLPGGQLAWLSPSLSLTPVPLMPQHSLGRGASARLEGPQLTVVAVDAQQHSSLDRYDTNSGRWQWSAPLGPGSVSQLWLLRDGGTATSLALADGGTELVTHGNAGQELERCPYGAVSGVAVTSELYVTHENGRITVFDVPGREAATSGWSGPHGFAGTGRAR